MNLATMTFHLAVVAMARRSRFRPCAITRPHCEIEADIFTLPLWTWAETQPRKTRRPRGSGVIVKHCRDCGCIINRSSRGQCKPCATVGLRRAVPEDFIPILRKLGSQGAARHYRASLATITRWRRELELKPQARMKKGIGQSRSDRGFMPRPLIQNRDMTHAGQAADFLRRFGSVYRCDPSGAASAKGTHWRRGFSILDDNDLMNRAARMGWCAAEM